jgi:AraC family transcriptional activator of pobA
MPQLASLTNTLSETLNTSKMFRQQIAVGLAHAVLGTIASLAPSTRFMPSDPRLADFDALILQHQKLGLSAADYAALLGVSTGHLSRLCRKATGRGAGAYIERSTMNEACRLLAFTRMPVAEIGYHSGYSDPSYFSKRFRAARGQTPTQYRAAFAS